MVPVLSINSALGAPAHRVLLVERIRELPDRAVDNSVCGVTVQRRD
jgi:hypothetical protein